MRKWLVSAVIVLTTYAGHGQLSPFAAEAGSLSAPQAQFLGDGGLVGEPLARFIGRNAHMGVPFAASAPDWGEEQSPYAGAITGAPAREDFGGGTNRSESSGTRYKASSYVPLDSWIYAAMDRLAVMGYLPTSTATIRPWTRLECARLLAEAHAGFDENDEAAAPLLAALDLEFAHETGVIEGAGNNGARVEDAYVRYTGIAGTPLRDSFHFGQSLDDDFGRPYGKGVNGITGLSVSAEAASVAVYVRGEYQHASAMPAYSDSAMQTIASYDGLPFGWDLRNGTTDRIRLIEAYSALNLADWQISFGQQSLWWGPDRTTSLILSNNAEAMPMLRFARVKPARMPGKLGWLGPVHFDGFFARQGGVHYVGLGPAFTLYGSAGEPLKPPPYLWGVNFSFKPTANFELGFAHTVIFAGYGRPLNLNTFLHTFSVLGNGQAVDPGKRTTEFNLTYHLPGFRRNVSVYTEEFAWDDPIEGKFLSRFAMDPGIYIARVPWVKRMDLRVEGVYTDLPGLVDGAYFYDNYHYPQGYTNYGQILGSWIGRQGSGGKACSTYWFNGRTKAAVSYRKDSADKAYLSGGNLSDISASMTWKGKKGTEISAMSQYERWKFPLLGAGTQSNITTSLELRVFAKMRIGGK
jgi:hypothetical protein